MSMYAPGPAELTRTPPRRLTCRQNPPDRHRPGARPARRRAQRAARSRLCYNGDIPDSVLNAVALLLVSLSLLLRSILAKSLTLEREANWNLDASCAIFLRYGMATDAYWVKSEEGGYLTCSIKRIIEDNAWDKGGLEALMGIRK